MVSRKKSEGIEALRPKQDPVSIQEITLLDWYAAFALMGISIADEIEPTAAAKIAFERADAMLQERVIRV